MAQLDIVHVSKAFGDAEVLRDINLQISSGEFVVFVGPSGCGKSTLLRIISGLEELSRGEIRLDGQLINDIDPAKRGVAMVFQSYALYPHMTAFENMGFSLKLARCPKPTIAQKVANAAGILRLESLLQRRPGTTMIYVTHDQVEAMTLADKMVVMNGGVVQQCGSPLKLYDDPDNMFVAGFIGSPRMNFLKAAVVGVTPDNVTVEGPGVGRLTLAFRGFRAETGQVALGIRPQRIGLPGAREGAIANRLELSATLTFAEELGDVTYLHGDLPGGERLVLRTLDGHYGGGRQLTAVADAASILLFDETGRRIRPTI
jgi:lactose/L-arabinose transport system ATP-binding protein